MKHPQQQITFSQLKELGWINTALYKLQPDRGSPECRIHQMIGHGLNGAFELIHTSADEDVGDDLGMALVGLAACIAPSVLVLELIAEIQVKRGVAVPPELNERIADLRNRIETE